VPHPSTLQEGREGTEAFRSHYNDERPQQGRACGTGPPRVAFPVLPTLPALPERVDPDAWLAPLDQKMYLRHGGRDGCVEVDLATSSIGPQMAGRTVLVQVEAQSRQFAVWHQDQVVTLPPIKGWLGQEMALDDSLHYILQEALAAPRRSSARRGRQSPPAFSGACSQWSTCGKPGVGRLGKDRGKRGATGRVNNPCPCILLTLLFSLYGRHGGEIADGAGFGIAGRRD
jgi:hypothetical protein